MNINKVINIKPTKEQEEFIKIAKTKKNILVDACVGSGKTTAIQLLCDQLETDLNILYLTYNKLLKVDAKNKIKNKNVLVTNYHGFAYNTLKQNNIKSGINDLILAFNNNNLTFDIYDVLIIDEYQDIDLDISKMLEKIKAKNKNMQIIVVGDYEQKIYDFSSLNVLEFIKGFLDQYIQLYFTTCFRLNNPYANSLGKVWNKQINGVNNKCEIAVKSKAEILDYIANQKTHEILCLGSIGIYSKMYDTLNELEALYPNKFNKKTVYASIREQGEDSIKPNKNCAIFTSYDRSKGLEKNVCIIFDFTYSYWEARIKKPNVTFSILRNIFCVACSRGKNKIIFVYQNDVNELMLNLDKDNNIVLDHKVLKSKIEYHNFQNVNISNMFDFKYVDDICRCYQLLTVNKVLDYDKPKLINIKSHDELIDISFCIGIYTEAIFFKDYSIDFANEFLITLKILLYEKNEKMKDFLLKTFKNTKKEPLAKKILFNAYLNTNQFRYYNQVDFHLIQNADNNQIINRLKTIFKEDEVVQQECEIPFYDENNQLVFKAIGICDVIKDDILYELKFVSELNYSHYLQAACYLIAFGLTKARLWNIKTNLMYEITIKDKKAFLNQVVKTLTKGVINQYYVNRENNEFVKMQIHSQNESVIENENETKSTWKKLKGFWNKNKK